MGIGIFVDIVLIAILILNIFVGYKKGLINVIFSVCAFFIAIVATFILYKPVSNIIINNTDIQEKIKSIIIQNSTEENSVKEVEDGNRLQKYIESKIDSAKETAKEEALELVADTIANKGIQILTGIILFIVIRIVLIVLKFFTESIAEIPIIKQFNQVGGLAFGILKGVIIILLLVTIMFFVVSVNGNGIIAKAIEQSYITKFVYENNIILNFFFK